MKTFQITLLISMTIAIISCNKNSEHNASMVSFLGMKAHDSLSLTELESNFDSPNDFIIISHYGKDMDFDSDYKEGDSLIAYYKYHLVDSHLEQVGIVFTYKDKALTICAPCGQEKVKEYEIVYERATERNIDLTIDALDSMGIREK